MAKKKTVTKKTSKKKTSKKKSAAKKATKKTAAKTAKPAKAPRAKKVKPEERSALALESIAESLRILAYATHGQYTHKLEKDSGSGPQEVTDSIDSATPSESASPMRESNENDLGIVGGSPDNSKSAPTEAEAKDRLLKVYRAHGADAAKGLLQRRGKTMVSELAESERADFIAECDSVLREGA